MTTYILISLSYRNIYYLSSHVQYPVRVSYGNEDCKKTRTPLVHHVLERCIEDDARDTIYDISFQTFLSNADSTINESRSCHSSFIWWPLRLVDPTTLDYASTWLRGSHPLQFVQVDNHAYRFFAWTPSLFVVVESLKTTSLN